MASILGRGKGAAQPPAGSVHALDLDAVRKLMADVKLADDNPLSCQETFAFLDEYIDRLVQGEPVDELMPRVKYHLDMCGQCGEHADMLLAMIDGSVSTSTRSVT